MFLSFLRSAISKVDASHVAVVFDHPEADNYRLKSSEYKSDRVQDLSDELDSPFHHLDNLKLVLKYVGVRYIESDLAEGDDMVAIPCHAILLIADRLLELAQQNMEGSADNFSEPNE